MGQDIKRSVEDERVSFCHQHLCLYCDRMTARKRVNNMLQRFSGRIGPEIVVCVLTTHYQGAPWESGEWGHLISSPRCPLKPARLCSSSLPFPPSSPSGHLCAGFTLCSGAVGVCGSCPAGSVSLGLQPHREHPGGLSVWRGPEVGFLFYSFGVN